MAMACNFENIEITPKKNFTNWYSTVCKVGIIFIIYTIYRHKVLIAKGRHRWYKFITGTYR